MNKIISSGHEKDSNYFYNSFQKYKKNTFIVIRKYNKLITAIKYWVGVVCWSCPLIGLVGYFCIEGETNAQIY